MTKIEYKIMKKNISGTSIIEAMVVLLVVLIAITWAYDMFANAIRVTEWSENKLMAISIAKEWIEAVTNIRDTNWKVLPWDYKNCWNVLNYNTDCFNDNVTFNDIPDNWSFTVWKDTNDYRWKLTQYSSWSYSDSTYRTNFQVGIDTLGFFTQTGTVNNLKPIFTREIEINYLEDGILWTFTSSEEQKMQVKSIVQWSDSSSKNVRKVEMETILTNWKNKID